MLFNNPYNDSDYDILEDLWSNTPAGKALDLLVQLTIGKGFKPRFEPRDKTLKPDAKEKLIKSYDKELEQLIKIDNLPQIQMDEKVDDLMRNALVFGRAVLAFEPGEGKLVQATKSIHPRDLGRVYVHQIDWSLSSVKAFNRGDLIRNNEMIYLVNMQNSPIRRSMWHGYSELQRSVGPARAWRQIFEFDLVEIVTSLWASYGILTVDNEGLSSGEKKTDIDTIMNNIKPGAINAINGKKDEFNFFPMDTQPKVGELDTIIDRVEREMYSNVDVPGALMGREEESNMATLLGKLRMFIAGPVTMRREWLEKVLSRQWYEYNLQFINKEILEHIEVKVEFEPIIFESWIDNVESIAKLRAVFPEIPNEELLKLAQLEDLTGKLATLQKTKPQENKPGQELEKPIGEKNEKQTSGTE
jgi:hypothetical protein